VVPLELSIVIPCYDEALAIDALLSRLRSAIDLMSVSAEIILVDDGSGDDSVARIEEAAQRDPRVKLVSLTRNFGQQAALSAGLSLASGRAVVMMDADLQDPPELLPEMLRLWREGYEVVYAVRRTRAEGMGRRAANALFYRSLRGIASVEVPLDAGDFSLLDEAVVEAIRSLPERNRFLRGLRSWVGFRQVALEYDRPPRSSGSPKYGLRKLSRLAVDGYVGFSSLPLRFAAFFGMAAGLAGFLLLVWILFGALTGTHLPGTLVPTAALILFMGGVQLLVLGVVGEYLGRVYDEVRERPSYLVRRTVGFAEAARERVRTSTGYRSERSEPGAAGQRPGRS
jgi:glycosyltransferase involved in cell wall biosynthesis